MKAKTEKKEGIGIRIVALGFSRSECAITRPTGDFFDVAASCRHSSLLPLSSFLSALPFFVNASFIHANGERHRDVDEDCDRVTRRGGTAGSLADFLSQGSFTPALQPSSSSRLPTFILTANSIECNDARWCKPKAKHCTDSIPRHFPRLSINDINVYSIE